ncbi:BTAD domain-containing putative transcriptional regulator [Nonomuraea sp. NEAU-A123]|uniref:BTAD domain-containing putative transcriptional regulator n=1 Tax=Nonomuraea sp. NEAU-A123 TaxID=2839649 RepID=UPI001BE3D1EB|nr:BTAD domain-containing putative transcriptional regulator [Nonomuraea sp. NEAU-A123]MBT2232181.1 AAA family ATPase [Nonomuraea sp. NEAU-A123]
MPLDLGPLKVRMLLAALVLAHPQPVRPDALIERIWGEEPPSSALAALHVYVGKLRRAVDPGRVVLGLNGYQLCVPAQAVDANRFLDIVARAQRALSKGDAADAEAEAARALAMWHGEPYTELDGRDYVMPVQAHLLENRDRARELRVSAILEQGRHAEILGDLAALTRDHPLRERLWLLRALALYRSGRQADALETLRSARRVLRDELGLDPGEELRQLERDILTQDPVLRPPRPAPARGPLPFVGRAAELGALRGLLKETVRGGAGFALVTGEPGIGKTRLVHEAVAHAQASGFQVAVGRCATVEGAPAFFPWTAVLEQLAIPEELHSIGWAPSGEDPEGARFRAYRVAERALTTAAARRPLAIVLDDLHWADASSLSLLRYLADVLERQPMAILCTARTDAPLARVREAFARRHAVQVLLEGLGLNDIARLAPESSEALRDRTGGNPFFLTELIRTGELRDALPLGVRDVVRARVGALPRPAAELLELAAVAGREFEVSVVAEMAELDLGAAVERLDPAIATGLIEAGLYGRFRFPHALVQEALAETLPVLRRAALHARAARATERLPGSATPERLATAAHHWFLAAPAGFAGQAWRAARRAAGAAGGLGAYDMAAELLERALPMLAADPGASAADRVDLLLALAEARHGSGDARGRRAVLAEARHLAAAAGYRRGLLTAATGTENRNTASMVQFGSWDGELIETLAGLAALPDLDLEDRCRVLGGLAVESYYQPGSSPAGRDALSAESVALARKSGDRRLLGWALHTRYLSIRGPDLPEERLAIATELAELGRLAGDDELLVLGLGLAGATLLQCLRFREARTLIDEAVAVAARALPYARVYLGWLRLGVVALTGDLPAARALFDETAALQRTTSMWGLAEAQLAGLLQLRLGGARDLDEELFRQAGTAAAGPLGEIVRDVHALLLIMDGRVAEARRLLGHWREQPPIPRTFLWLAHAGVRGVVWAYLGDRTACAELYEQLLPYADRMAIGNNTPLLWPMTRPLALLAGVLGLPEATGHAEHALRTAADLGAGGLVAVISGELDRLRR